LKKKRQKRQFKLKCFVGKIGQKGKGKEKRKDKSYLSSMFKSVLKKFDLGKFRRKPSFNQLKEEARPKGLMNKISLF